MSGKKLRNRADWLDFEHAEEIRKELEEMPDWKKQALGILEYEPKSDWEPVSESEALARDLGLLSY